MSLGRRFARVATGGGAFIGSVPCIASSDRTCHIADTGTHGMTSSLVRLIGTEAGTCSTPSGESLWLGSSTHPLKARTIPSPRLARSVSRTHHGVPGFSTSTLHTAFPVWSCTYVSSFHWLTLSIEWPLDSSALRFRRSHDHETNAARIHDE